MGIILVLPFALTLEPLAAYRVALVITGVWWAVIVQWHAYRYLGRALRAVTDGATAAAASPTDAPS